MQIKRSRVVGDGACGIFSASGRTGAGLGWGLRQLLAFSPWTAKRHWGTVADTEGVRVSRLRHARSVPFQELLIRTVHPQRT